MLAIRTLPLSTLLVLGCAPGLLADQSEAELASVAPGDRDHWAYLAVELPPVPAVSDTTWIRTPIDNFVLARLEKKGWRPNLTAQPSDLLRRLYLDLIGLPPTIAEQDRFLDDPSAERLDAAADRLLRRPGYGERWARNWLDLVRYAESNGYERDAEKPHVWRYRDYVIDAFNNDKPYDQFVLEQLAGDELEASNSETVIATGFYRLGPWDDEPADFAQDRHDQLDDMIRTTSQVFLGLTMGCARCHDHKFDALTMRDYYRMSAILAPMERPQAGRTDLDAPAGSREQLAILAERDRRIEELRDQQRVLRDSFHDEFLASGQSKLDKAVLAAFRISERERSEAQQQLTRGGEIAFRKELEANLPPRLRSRFDDLEQQAVGLLEQLADLPRAYFLSERTADPPKSFVLLRGRAALPGPEVLPGLPAVLVRNQPLFEASERSTGRRLALARWVARPENPLTARVIVNRVWQYHFGEGIVRTPSDFGVMGDLPTHPELLDWLAHWFVNDAKWSIKRLQSLIVRSNTYRMSKASNAVLAETDPENRLLWRFHYRRLPVEVIRDSMLATSGGLNRKMYGPSVRLQIPAVVIEGHADRHKIWKPSSIEEQSRRTVYAFVKRSLVVPMLDVLDLCDTTRSTDKRSITTVAPQALTLFNGEFVNQQARHLAARVIDEAGDDPAAQVELAWRLALCRVPDESERQSLADYLKSESMQTITNGDETSVEAHRRALIQACRVIYNLNEFVYSN
jgi:hypothetical protein